MTDIVRFLALLTWHIRIPTTKPTIIPAGLIVALSGFYQTPSAAQDHHHRHRADSGSTQETHVHGVAELFVVLEGEQLDIELRSPAMSLLGFEHRANTPEQKARVENARKILANAGSLFQFYPALCHMTDHRADFSSVVKENTLRDKSHHDEEHDTEHHDKHHEAHGHSDIEAHYRYRCEQPDQLASLLTTIPVEFPGIESLQVQWIVNDRQGAVTLDKNQRQINLR